MRKLDNTNRTRKKNVRHSWVKAGPGIQRCAICGITKQKRVEGREDLALRISIIW